MRKFCKESHKKNKKHEFFHKREFGVFCDLVAGGINLKAILFGKCRV